MLQTSVFEHRVLLLCRWPLLSMPFIINTVSMLHPRCEREKYIRMLRLSDWVLKRKYILSFGQFAKRIRYGWILSIDIWNRKRQVCRRYIFHVQFILWMYAYMRVMTKYPTGITAPLMWLCYIIIHGHYGAIVLCVRCKYFPIDLACCDANVTNESFEMPGLVYNS
jgi:hypothetical protein